MFSIVYGVNTADAEAFVNEKIHNTAKDDVWLLVPEQFSLSTERAVIKRFGIAAQTRVKVITFSRLCNLALSALGPLRAQYIDGAGKQIIAARTIRALKGKLNTLASNLKKHGFASSVVSLASEFKRYGVEPEFLDAAADETENAELAEKLKDVSLMYKTYSGFLKQQMADAEDNLALICPRIKECSFLRGTLYITHFRSFTPVEYEAVGELMRLMDVCAVMCCDDIYKSSALFAPVAETCRSLTDLAETNGIECMPPLFLEDTGSDGDELVHLRRNYFEGRPKPYHAVPQNVKIYELSNRCREIETAADLIIRLCREQDKSFSDFLVLARDTEAYSRIMPAIFQSRGIDVFLDSRRSVLTKPFAVMLCLSLEIIAYGYSYDRVMGIARSGMTDIPDGDIDLFENYLLAVNPTHAMWNDAEWTYGHELGYDMEMINRTRKKLTAFADGVSARLSGRKTAEQICSAILAELEACDTAAHLTKVCDSFSENGMPYLADEYRQVWNSVISVLSQISTLMDEENITWKDFIELFKSACGGISVGLTPQTQGSVVFSPIDKFRTEGVPIVIVLGMTDGVFPSAHTSEGILSDTERAELLKAGIRLAPGADAKRREEQLLIYSVLTAPSEQLYLFTPLTDSAGKQLLPSPIIKNIRTKIFPQISVYNPDGGSDPMRGAEGKNAAFDVLCAKLAECGGQTDKLSGAAGVLYSFFKDSPEYGERLAAIAKAMTAKEPEKISRDAVREIYGDKIMLSASKLEKYNACAFAYFMTYGLLAAERDRAGIEPRSMGSIQHAALYAYFTELKNSGTEYSSVTKEACFDRIYSIVHDEAVKSTELLYESSSYYKYVVTRMQGIAARTAWEVVKFYKSSKFRPVGFEIKIDTGGEIPALVIQDGSGTEIAALRGIIDRADSAVINGKTYVSIIDYKSSQKGLDERLAAAGVNIQPLLYSDIVCRRMNANPAAMLYMQMTDPIVDAAKLTGKSNAEKEASKLVKLGGWLTDDAGVIAGYSSGGENGENYVPAKSSLIAEDEMKSRISAANEKIRESALGIYEGNVKARPYIGNGFNACQYCIFSASCGRNI